MKYLYPLILKNNFIKNFDIEKNIKIRKIKDNERENFFGLKKVDFCFSKKPLPGWVAFNKLHSSRNKKVRLKYDKWIFWKGIFDGSSDILAANYILEVDTQDSPDFVVRDIDLAFKIFKPCSTALCIGFPKHDNSVHFSGLFVGPFLPYLEIKNTEELQKIKNIYKKILSYQNDDRFKIICELYKKALSGVPTDLGLRFILSVICIESLVLPDSNGEKRFRFSLVIAKILSKYFRFNVYNEFKLAQEIYDTRSEIVHTGKSDKLNDHLFSEIIKRVSLFINLYLENSNVLKGGNLVKTCLV